MTELVYEIFNKDALIGYGRVVIVRDEEIAKEICLQKRRFIYRPTVVANDMDEAEVFILRGNTD